MKNNLTPLSFAGLADWLHAHPGATIVTDVKDDNLRALKKIAADYPDLIDRVIPQIYAFEEYEPVWNMGYRNIILTLYVKNYPDAAGVGLRTKSQTLRRHDVGPTGDGRRCRANWRSARLRSSPTPSICRRNKRNSRPTVSAAFTPIS